MQASYSSPPASPSRRFPLGAALFFGLILLFVAFSRFSGLGSRVLHHDESLFSYYGWYLAQNGLYDHDPLLHGPLQIEILAGVFRFVPRFTGDETLSRFPAAFAGFLTVLLLFAWRRWLGWRGVLIAATLLAVSPGFWYYSRFCRNEALFVFAGLLIVVAVARAWTSRRPSGWIVLSFFVGAVLLSLKENALFLAFDGLTFLILVAIARGRGASWRPLGYSLRKHRNAWFAGLALAWLVLMAVYTFGFRNSRAFLEFYPRILSYWFGQHREHRLYGEFHYHLSLLALYEPLLFGVGGVAVWRALFSGRVGRWGRWVALGVVVAGYGAAWMGGWRWARGGEEGSWPVLRMLHMTHPWHLAGAAGGGWLTLWGAWRCLRVRRGMRAWLVWWTGLSFLQYSYAGEKVPWLVLHISVPATLLAADFLNGWFERLRRFPARRTLVLGVVALFVGWNAFQGWRLCFINATSPLEWMVYNHTRPAVADLGRDLRDAAREGAGVLVQGAANWPLVWYLREVPSTYVMEEEEAPLEGIEHVVCDSAYAKRYEAIRDGYALESIELRRAWDARSLRPWPFGSNPDGADWLRLGRYVLLRKPWGQSPEISTTVLSGRTRQ